MRGAISTASRPSATAETKAVPGSTAVTEAVARNLFKLMAIKDEYEVARLYTDGSFAKQLSQASSSTMTGWNSISRRRSSGRRGADGKPRKSSFGPWMMKGFRAAGAR